MKLKIRRHVTSVDRTTLTIKEQIKQPAWILDCECCDVCGGGFASDGIALLSEYDDILYAHNECMPYKENEH